MKRELEITRHNVTPSQFLSYVRARMKKKGFESSEVPELKYWKAGNDLNFGMVEHYGVREKSVSKPYEMQTFIAGKDYIYNLICEFEFDDEETGTGYFYYNNSDVEMTEEPEPAETEPESAEATAEQEPEITVTLEWCDRKPDWEPDWNVRHHKKVHGTPEECMAQIRTFKDNHDVVKYTPVDIIDISRRETA